MSQSQFGGWFVDLVAGGLGGLVIAWIVAVNLVIYLGVEGGYQAGPGDVFEHSWILGTVVVAILAAGPVLAVTYMRRQRRQRNAVGAGLPGEGHGRGSG
ncbi:MAG: hypothetical protein ACLFRT_08445 [Actinomycetota bacterium]